MRCGGIRGSSGRNVWCTLCGVVPRLWRQHPIRSAWRPPGILPGEGAFVRNCECHENPIMVMVTRFTVKFNYL